MLFRIRIFKFTEVIFIQDVEYDNQQLADAYALGVYNALELSGKEPTGVTSKYIQYG